MATIETKRSMAILFQERLPLGYYTTEANYDSCPRDLGGIYLKSQSTGWWSWFTCDRLVAIFCPSEKRVRCLVEVESVIVPICKELGLHLLVMKELG